MKAIQLLRSSPFGIEGSYLLCFRFQLFKPCLPIPTAEFRFIGQSRQIPLRILRALFFDTGAFFAKEIAADQYHIPAAEFWRDIHEKGLKFYSSEHVLDETATLLARRSSYAWSAELGRDVLVAGIHFLPAGRGDFAEAFSRMKKIADQAVSFTDCISFVLMKKQGLSDAFGL